MKPGTRSPGFTLVELIVALAITAAIAGIVLAVTIHVLGLWRRAQDAFTLEAQAAIVLDHVERDLQAATFRPDGATWLAIDLFTSSASLGAHGWRENARGKPPGNPSHRLLPMSPGATEPSIAAARFGLGGAWLRFFTTNVESKGSANPGGSLPVAVSYQVMRRPVSGGIAASNRAAVRYTLFRSAVSNTETFLAGMDLRAAAYTSASPTPAPARSARSLTNPATGDALATNAIDFGVYLYRRSVSGQLRRIFPDAAMATDHAARVAEEFPEVVDVMLRLLTEEGARILAQIETEPGRLSRPSRYATDAEWWWAVAEQHSHVYVRRVELKGGR